MIDLPIKFDQLVKMPGGAGGTGYPYRISAKDLMANFEYAALDADESWILYSSGPNGARRSLNLPALPIYNYGNQYLTIKGDSALVQWSQGIPDPPEDNNRYILSVIGGIMTWIETEEIELQYVKDNAPASGTFFKKP